MFLSNFTGRRAIKLHLEFISELEHFVELMLYCLFSATSDQCLPKHGWCHWHL